MTKASMVFSAKHFDQEIKDADDQKIINKDFRRWIMSRRSFFKNMFFFGIVAISISGCVTAADHAKQLHSDSDRRMTVGTVQKEIRKGMSQADVAAALGSPNIVTKDKEGVETWIYDKIATEVSYSRSSVGGGVGGLLIGGVGALGGGVSGSQAAGAAAQTQRTLTVIIKFKDGLVHDFTYHTSKF